VLSSGSRVQSLLALNEAQSRASRGLSAGYLDQLRAIHSKHRESIQAVSAAALSCRQAANDAANKATEAARAAVDLGSSATASHGQLSLIGQVAEGHLREQVAIAERRAHKAESAVTSLQNKLARTFAAMRCIRSTHVRAISSW